MTQSQHFGMIFSPTLSFPCCRLMIWHFFITASHFRSLRPPPPIRLMEGKFTCFAYLPLTLCSHISLTWPSVFCLLSSCLYVSWTLSCLFVFYYSPLLRRRALKARHCRGSGLEKQTVSSLPLHSAQSLLGLTCLKTANDSFAAPLNFTSKGNKMVDAAWQFYRWKWAVALQMWAIISPEFNKACRNHVYPSLLNIKLLQKNWPMTCPGSK